MSMTVLTPAVVRVPWPNPLLAIESRTEGADTIVVLQGESDVSTTALLSDALARVVAVDAGDVVIDLGSLAFCDSASVRVLATARQLLSHHDRALTFRSPNRLATRILGIFGLTDQIETSDVTKATPS